MGLFKKNKKNEPRSNELDKEKGVFHGFALLSEKITFFLNFFFERKLQRAA